MCARLWRADVRAQGVPVCVALFYYVARTAGGPYSEGIIERYFTTNAQEWTNRTPISRKWTIVHFLVLKGSLFSITENTYLDLI